MEFHGCTHERARLPSQAAQRTNLDAFPNRMSVTMSDWPTIIQNAVAGLLTGGAGATSTLLAFFKDVRKRLDNVDRLIGSPGSTLEPRTGFYLIIGQLTETVTRIDDDVKRLRRGYDSFEDDPPEWFTRALNRRSSYVPGDSADYDRIEKIAKNALERAKQAEADLERLRTDLERLIRDVNTVEDDYDRDSTKRADEIRRIQENLSTVNGFLRGVMATLGYIDAAPPAPPPPPPSQQLPPRRK